MKTFLQKLIQQELNEQIHQITPIKGFGSVNQVFTVRGSGKNYIVRLNQDVDRIREYEKEHACIQAAAHLGIPSPSVLSFGQLDDQRFMIQEQIEGINGILLSPEKKLQAWEAMGSYCARYQQLSDANIPQLAENDFHEGWEAKRQYNIDQLTDTDPLLDSFSTPEHQLMKTILLTLPQPARIGLLHGDLSLRNVIAQADTYYLIDWGAAERDPVPLAEIGRVIQQEETNEQEFKAFIKGMGFSEEAYRALEPIVLAQNLLDRLDKFRWATAQKDVALSPYVDKLRIAYDQATLHHS